jgi:Arc/MetJ-type ribon-helix-helix transcriptional regulator
MTVTLDPVSEKRIQDELAKGRYRAPVEVIAHALDLLEAERGGLEALATRLQHSFDQSERGETYTPQEARALLADRLSARQ